MGPKVVTLVLLVALSGCSGNKQPLEDRIAGEWRGDMPMPKFAKDDPNFRQFADMMKDSMQLEISADHTYSLHFGAEKTGTWKLVGREIRFEETGSHSPMDGFMTDPFAFGTATPAGTRVYSAILSPDDKELTLLTQTMGETTFHR